MNQKGSVATLILVLILGLILGASGFYLYSQNTSPTKAPALMPSATPTAVATASASVQNSLYTDWKTYSNYRQDFSIKYPTRIDSLPEEWIYVESFPQRPDSGFALDVAFGTTTSKIGGYIWGVYVYEKNFNDGVSVYDKYGNDGIEAYAKYGDEKGLLEYLIAEQGEQFADRKETRQNIIVNQNPAILVIVTTAQNPEWISKSIYLEKYDKIYKVSNGAVEMPEFDYFYQSLKVDR